MEPITLYPSKVRMLGVAVGSLICMLIGPMLRQFDDTPAQISTLVMVLGIPFFGVALVYALYRLCVPKPVVVINQEGIFDNATATGAGLLRWEEIAEIAVYEFMNQRMLGITPIDVQALLARQSSLKRKVMQANINMGMAPVNIPQTTLPISVEQLYESIQQYHSHQTSFGGT